MGSVLLLASSGGHVLWCWASDERRALGAWKRFRKGSREASSRASDFAGQASPRFKTRRKLE